MSQLLDYNKLYGVAYHEGVLEADVTHIFSDLNV